MVWKIPATVEIEVCHSNEGWSVILWADGTAVFETIQFRGEAAARDCLAWLQDEVSPLRGVKVISSDRRQPTIPAGQPFQGRFDAPP